MPSTATKLEPQQKVRASGNSGRSKKPGARPSPPTLDDGGLPGKVSETGLILRKNLNYERWEHTMGLIGFMGRASPWWFGDAVIYGEDHFGEKHAQGIEAAGYEPGNAANIVSVCRRVEPARRRKELTFSHHVAVTHCTPEEQIRWLARAVAGDTLPNNERKVWSVARLRKEVRENSRASEGPNSGDEAEGNVPVSSVAVSVGTRFRVQGEVIPDGDYVITSFEALEGYGVVARLERLGPELPITE